LPSSGLNSLLPPDFIMLQSCWAWTVISAAICWMDVSCKEKLKWEEQRKRNVWLSYTLMYLLMTPACHWSACISTMSPSLRRNRILFYHRTSWNTRRCSGFYEKNIKNTIFFVAYVFCWVLNSYYPKFGCYRLRG
jgi:hypothetical protein